MRNPFRVLGRVLAGVGRLILLGLQTAERRGLTDNLVDMALSLVTRAQVQFQTNEERRSFVLNRLKAYGVPENVARLALELAVAVYKGQVATP